MWHLKNEMSHPLFSPHIWGKKRERERAYLQNSVHPYLCIRIVAQKASQISPLLLLLKARYCCLGRFPQHMQSQHSEIRSLFLNIAGTFEEAWVLVSSLACADFHLLLSLEAQGCLWHRHIVDTLINIK